MQLGVVGLGRMGGNIARRLKNAGHEIVVFDVDAKAVDTLTGEGMTGASGLDDIIGKLKAPRAVWIMLPAGEITEETIKTVAAGLEAGDIIIDGGNSFYKDDIRRAAALREKQIAYIDVGTSGGVWGLERGYCMQSIISTRSSRPWHPVSGPSNRRQGVKPATRAPSMATSTPVLPAPAISSR
jgi:6-phosphogluconate dehydrogenase